MKTARLLVLALLASGALPAHAQPAPPPGGAGGPPPNGFPAGGPPAMPSMAQTQYSAAIAIKDGVLTQPVGADVTGTPPSAVLAPSLLDRIAIRSATPERNGVIVSGSGSSVTLSNATILLSGIGKNDFLGIGAGAMVRDHGALTIDHATIETSGAVSSAAVAAEGATLRIHDSTLIANGGPLPADYKPHIGPGMMQPPAPLGLTGDARTLLAMSNSKTFIDHSTIVADGWGALSTDATGGNLYLEADDSTVKVRGIGYASYGDFGAHVVLNRTSVETGGYVGIIAGKAHIDLNSVTGHAAKSAVMIHSVMGDPQEVGELTLTDTTIATGGPVLLVKSANADIAISGGSLTSDEGILLLVRRNDDANATRTHGAKVPGVRLAIRSARLKGDVVSSDTDRETTVSLVDAQLAGALSHVVLSADAASHWLARANSDIALAVGTPLGAIDAPAGVAVIVHARDAALARGSHALASGGTLTIED